MHHVFPGEIALDYLWNGNEKAKAWCTTISNWANKIGPKNIKDGYNLDRSVTGTNHNMSFVGDMLMPQCATFRMLGTVRF
jgi:hypothetical protein